MTGSAMAIAAARSLWASVGDADDEIKSYGDCDDHISALTGYAAFTLYLEIN